jgi:hypothetical protein
VAPLPWGSRPVGNPTFPRCQTYRARFRCLIRPLEWDRFPPPNVQRFQVQKSTTPCHIGPDVRRCVRGIGFSSLEAEVRAVWLSPCRAGLAGLRPKRLRRVSRFGGMLLSPSPFGFRLAVNPEVSLRTSFPCGENLAPDYAAHDLVADDLAAVDIQDHVQVPPSAHNSGGQVCNVPAEHLAWACRHMRAWRTSGLRRLGTSTVLGLPSIPQHSAEAGLASDVDALVRQRWHDASRRQLGEARFVSDLQDLAPFVLAQRVRRGGPQGLRASISAVQPIASLPALQRAHVESSGREPLLARAPLGTGRASWPRIRLERG